MSGKDNKTMHEKLKHVFKKKFNTSNFKVRSEYDLKIDVEKNLGPANTPQQRVKMMKELCEVIQNEYLENHVVEKLWVTVQDLLKPDVAKEYRLVTFYFLTCLIKGQYEKLGIMRSHFYRVIKEHNVYDDIEQRLDVLISLTENGKYVQYFEEDIGPFVLGWMPEIMNYNRASNIANTFLKLLNNLIKFNASYLDEDVISGIVKQACQICCCSGKSEELVNSSLTLLDTVICYSNFPASMLEHFITSLCITVNEEEYCSISWKVMRNILGTHMGHSTLFTLCKLIQVSYNSNKIHLLRGGILYIRMALWGQKRVQSLNYRPTAVLPTLIQAMASNNSVVIYEVILTVKRIISELGKELRIPSWDLIFTVFDNGITHIERTAVSAPTVQISNTLHETITSVETLLETGQFNGHIQRLYEIVNRCSPSRPVSSVINLINYLAKEICPVFPHWRTRLNGILSKFFLNETRTEIRIHSLDILASVMKLNRSRYEDELIDNSVAPFMKNIHSDPDILVRNAAVQLVIELCLDCDSKRFMDLLDILEKVLKRPFESTQPVVNETEILDVKTVILGLIRMLMTKIYALPSIHAIHVYHLLLSYLETHYQRIKFPEEEDINYDYREDEYLHNNGNIRYMIFECFLQIRANSLFHIGFPDTHTGKVRYSSYLAVGQEEKKEKKEKDKDGERSGSPPPVSPTPALSVLHQVTCMSLSRACAAIITAIQKEKDWKVLCLLLQEVPQIMQNKALMLRQNDKDVDKLASAICALINNKAGKLPERLRNVVSPMTRTEFHGYIYPALASFASYHAHIEPSVQQKIIKCLKTGLMSRCAGKCVTALTICMLEMRDSMHKLLPEVLLNLSKISATVHIAIPILEFLSTLTKLPKVFGSFVGDQYMSVFAISLPYTNPFKYNHYIVSLAHHVIAVWFLKCRLPFRREFVKFITVGLRANVLTPFEEVQVSKADIINEDSSTRKRSSSLTEQGSRRRGIPPSARPGEVKPPRDETGMFHLELTETCIDLMARYTFSTCTPSPKRFPTAEFLLAGGQTGTWLVGHKLVTITTSGCSQKVLKNGLCDRCWRMCQAERSKVSDVSSPDVDIEGLKSKRTVQRSSSNEGQIPSSEEPLTSKLSRQLSIDVPSQINKTTISGDETKKGSALDSAESGESEATKLDQMLFGGKPPESQQKHYCVCWCQGWAEVYVRRPTGDMSWVMRIQNQITHSVPNSPDFPLDDITTLFMPIIASRKEQQIMEELKRQQIDTEALTERDYDAFLDKQFEDEPLKSSGYEATAPILIPGSSFKRNLSREDSIEETDVAEGDAEEYGKSRNPVGRSNSSPEMSASWKTSFLKEKKDSSKPDTDLQAEGETQLDIQKLNKAKEQRVSCEAIPEEIAGAGTTPPSVPSNKIEGAPVVHQRSQIVQDVVQPSHVRDTRQSVNISPVVTARPPQSPSQLHRSKIGADAGKPLRGFDVKSPLDAKHVPPLDKSAVRTTSSPISSTSTEKGSKEEQRPDPSALPPLSFRDRGHTISVMSPVRKLRVDWTGSKKEVSTRKDIPRSGINPSFVFLQLYHSAHFGPSTEKPLLVPQSDVIQRAVKNLDRMPPYETHKVGVLYVGPGQVNSEVEILKNQYGSVRYAEFLQRIGTLISLKDVNPQNVYLGGLETNGNDGKFAYIWQDDVIQVIFHVATLMPNKENEPNCNSKKLHIGNGYVTIVYNESGEEYNIQTLKAQFNYACVVIHPLDLGTNQVVIKAREELSEYLGLNEPKIVSDENLGILARQLALHANLASLIACSLKTQGQDPYASNWLERLRQIKRLRAKVQQEMASSNESSSYESEMLSPRSAARVYVEDFTTYT